MELNEKIAARRRELAVEAGNVEKAARDAVEAEVTKRLAEHGIAQPFSIEDARVKKAEEVIDNTRATNRIAAQEGGPSASSEVSTKAVDAEVQRFLYKAASARTTSSENAVFYTILGVSLATQIICPWWVLLIVAAWAIVYKAHRIEKHKEEILAEGKAKREREQKEIGQDLAWEKIPLGPA